MARFIAASDIHVCLNSESGDLLGTADFRNGEWSTDSEELASAMRRALPACREWKVAEDPESPAPPPANEPQPEEPEVEASQAAISPEAPPSSVAHLTERRRRRPSASEGDH